MKLAESRKILNLLSIFFLSLTGLGLNTFFFHQPVLGILFGTLFFGILSFFTGHLAFPFFPRLQKVLFGLLFVFCEIIIAGTLTYYLYKITPLISFFILFVPVVSVGIGALFSKKSFASPLPREKKEPLGSYARILSMGVVALDTMLLVYLFFHRIFDLAASPWQHVSPAFFGVYAAATAILFWNCLREKNKHSFFLLTSFHLFVGFSVAALMYPLGYGFDAFIHRATEQWIFEHGFISPKTPYYIGQYSLVVILTHITAIPLKYIDIYLLPLLSSLLLPGITIFSFKKSFPHREEYASVLFWLIPFFPFLYFHLTTPHNIVVFLTLIAVFFILLSLLASFPLWPLWLVALTALSTHALVGMPLFVVIFFYVIIKNIQNIKRIKIPLILLIISLALLLPLLFTLNGIRIHAPLPELDNPIEKIPQFLKIFERPYWYAKTSSWYFEILYFCERMIIPSLLIFSAIGAFAIDKKEKNKHFWIFTSSFLGFFVSAFTLASTIVFPDVVAYEQSDYPLRLLRVSVLFLIPGAMYGVAFCMENLQKIKLVEKKKKILFPLLLITLSLIATVILYLSYPQRNQKVRFPGYNVTLSDIKTVEWIHERHQDYNYIVLANQLVSAAALDTYSFAKYFKTNQGELFYYAIPTGGKLYSYYGKMIYEGQKREYMEEAMDLTGVKTAYFVVNSYWARSSDIIAGAKATADESYSIDDGNVWIFVYHQK